MTVPGTTPRFDLDDMRRRLGHDETLIADLLQMFLDTYPDQLDTVRSAVSARNLEDVRRAAHTFRGAASNLSAGGVMSAAGALERAAERGEADAVDALFASVALEAEELAAELREHTLRRLR